VQRERGELKQSVASMQRAIDLNPNDVDSYIFLANVQLGIGDVDESLRLVECASNLSTRTSNWHRAVHGSALYICKRYEEAADMLESMQNLPFAQRLLAMTYAQAGVKEKADAIAKVFLERYPDFSIDKFMNSKLIQREDVRAHYWEGLEKAGFPS